ncbi:MAG: hypothetical protein KDA84_11610 [Planctomycetaceae bacterium]|nr:hypothetical protein [Planctomycetaceae bacterium]
MTKSEEQKTNHFNNQPTQISESHLERLYVRSESQWRELQEELIPLALTQLRVQFKLPAEQDRNNTEAALWSSWPSFQKHFLSGQYVDATDIWSLAGQLARLAYNRSQRKVRNERKWTQQTAVARTDRESELPDLANPASSETSPFEGVHLKLLFESVEGIIEEIASRYEADSKDLRIIQTWLQGMERSQRTIAELVGEDVSQASVSRALAAFKAEILRRFSEADPR